ncbi:MAG: uracil-DNA glycosylase [Myxococcota bacterium]
MTLTALRARLSVEAAAGNMPIDTPVYAEANLSPTTPLLLGQGSLAARVGFFGRDPGRHEVLKQEPFIGAGGRLIRSGLHRLHHGTDCPDDAAALAIGTGYFWGNTVPFKPIKNKVWSVKIRRRFAPIITDLLCELWQGDQLITLGNVSFDWFRLADPALKAPLKAFWARPDRYTASLTITLRGKPITLHPLPHPSPLNAAWFGKFPGLLDARLRSLRASKLRTAG